MQYIYNKVVNRGWDLSVKRAKKHIESPGVWLFGLDTLDHLYYTYNNIHKMCIFNWGPSLWPNDYVC